ncbi:MAG: hypothetical protein ABFD92_00060 [Planctomycetaceae bacterium]|nr:hypothetical protein [Planctomycetaceae bacterium]
MVTNCTVTAWLRRTGSDEHGTPAFAAQDGQWKGLAEPVTKTLKLAGRELTASIRLHVFGILPYEFLYPGDRCSVDGVAYEVAQYSSIPRGVFRGVAVMLAPI